MSAYRGADSTDRRNTFQSYEVKRCATFAVLPSLPQLGFCAAVNQIRDVTTIGSRRPGAADAVTGPSAEFSASMIIRVSTNKSCNKRVSSFALLENCFEFFFERAW